MHGYKFIAKFINLAFWLLKFVNLAKKFEDKSAKICLRLFDFITAPVRLDI
ncbi:hypothetical protein CSUNSWCD_1326 [Campylobacter showae CSUNSWCD]|uniref:Uncharacterized protein n=1 Tax=Campylobacter showae CSUNSWCD TaxID=1244083 RepID=M5IHI4_9BACT|nr:hypothetical protein CSUNSWCD_1326 [Campylobacter showae CSUNSWCD]